MYQVQIPRAINFLPKERNSLIDPERCKSPPNRKYNQWCRQDGWGASNRFAITHYLFNHLNLPWCVLPIRNSEKQSSCWSEDFTFCAERWFTIMMINVKAKVKPIFHLWGPFTLYYLQLWFAFAYKSWWGCCVNTSIEFCTIHLNLSHNHNKAHSVNEPLLISSRSKTRTIEGGGVNSH